MIQVFKPHVGEDELQAIREVFESGWLGLGPRTQQFEQQFADYTGVKCSVGVNSATAALDLAVRLLDIRHGDEVIVPTMTFVSTAHVVAYNLANPVFVDVDRETMNISIEDVERKITRKTMAIIPVHYSGRPVDMDALRAVAKDIPLIEDASHACGSEYKGKKAGSLGTMGCFSFQAVKNLCAGDGGAITLNNESMAERAKRLRWLGIDKGTWDRTGADQSYWWEYNVDEIGLKCHMNDITAAMALVQLAKLNNMNKRRLEIASMYTRAFQDMEQITVPAAMPKGVVSSWHIYCVQALGRNELSLYLQEKGIATGVHYKPIHLYRCYGNRPCLPVAEELFGKILSLPIYPDLTDEQVNYVIENIFSFYNRG